MKNKFLNICIGLGILFLTGGFFIRSVNTANATPPAPEEIIEGGTNKIGKYLWEGDGSHYMIWDTETGKSIQYSYNNGWQKISDQLPENPFAQ